MKPLQRCNLLTIPVNQLTEKSCISVVVSDSEEYFAIHSEFYQQTMFVMQVLGISHTAKRWPFQM